MPRGIQVESIFKLHCLRDGLTVLLCRFEFDFPGGLNRALCETMRQALDYLNVRHMPGLAQDRGERNAAADVMKSRRRRVIRDWFVSNPGLLGNPFGLIDDAVAFLCSRLAALRSGVNTEKDGEHQDHDNDSEKSVHDLAPNAIILAQVRCISFRNRASNACGNKFLMFASSVWPFKFASVILALLQNSQ